MLPVATSVAKQMGNQDCVNSPSAPSAGTGSALRAAGTIARLCSMWSTGDANTGSARRSSANSGGTASMAVLVAGCSSFCLATVRPSCLPVPQYAATGRSGHRPLVCRGFIERPGIARPDHLGTISRSGLFGIALVFRHFCNREVAFGFVAAHFFR